MATGEVYSSNVSTNRENFRTPLAVSLLPMALTKRRQTTSATPSKALGDATNLRKNVAPATAPAHVDGPARRTRSTRKISAAPRKESPLCLTKKSVRKPRKNEATVVAAPAAEAAAAPARPPATTARKNVSFAALPAAVFYVRKRDAFAVVAVAVVASLAVSCGVLEST